MPVFRKPMFMADCDRCGARFDPVRGGVCRECRRILCGYHLFGSLTRRLKIRFSGQAPVCTECLARAAPRGPSR